VQVGAAGVTAIESSVPVPTVRVVVPVTPDEDAEIETVPPFLPCAIPVERMEAIFGFEDFHEMPARFVATLPSLNVPLAVNFIDVPLSILGFAGLTVIETKCAVETVSVVEPLTDPKAAVMVLFPVATLVARPRALIVATADEDELQSTDAVRSCVLESLNVPVAVNCFVVPTAMLPLAGVTTIETSVAAVTVSDAVPLTDPEVAVIVAVPVPTPAASPFWSMLTIDDDDELQVTDINS
jgi:hypothetical protein